MVDNIIDILKCYFSRNEIGSYLAYNLIFHKHSKSGFPVYFIQFCFDIKRSLYGFSEALKTDLK